MQTFNEWISDRLPLILKGLKAEAIKAGSFEEFKQDFHTKKDCTGTGRMMLTSKSTKKKVQGT